MKPTELAEQIKERRASGVNLKDQAKALGDMDYQTMRALIGLTEEQGVKADALFTKGRSLVDAVRLAVRKPRPHKPRGMSLRLFRPPQ
jgi:hypothetical protein